MDNVQSIKSLLISIMIVAFSQDIGCDDNSDLLLSEHHLRSLNSIIKGSTIKDPVDKEEITEETLFDDSSENAIG